MLYPVRERAGLGSPPEPFYTNAVESKNNVLKQHLERKLSTLPDFVDSMRTLLNKQRQEIEMAVASMGEYRVVPKYSHLAYEHTKWFTMSPKQRQAKVSQFMKHTVEEGNTTETGSSRVDINPLAGTGLPSHVANTIWKCAKLLTVLFRRIQQSSRPLVMTLPLWLRASVGSVHITSRLRRKVDLLVMINTLDSNRPECAPTRLLLH